MAAGYVIPTAHENAQDQLRGRPVVLDVIAPDKQTSLLPPDLKLVLHVNPQSMNVQYSNSISRQQTEGGFIENHWGKHLQSISFEHATGGFVRLYAGLSNKTGVSAGGSLQSSGSEATAVQGRRETLAYDSYLDYLALFHHNGMIYDGTGRIVQRGYIKVIFDEGSYLGWFQGDLTMTESVDKAFQISFTSQFEVHEELVRFSTTQGSAPGGQVSNPQTPSSNLFAPAPFAGLFSEA